MKVLFELGHPKHYYQFRSIIKHYQERNDKVLILARRKDILLKLLDEENQKYKLLGLHGKNLFAKGIALIGIVINYIKILYSFKPDLLVSKGSPYIAIFKPFIRGKIVIAPDAEIVRVTNIFTAPLSDLVITPITFRLNYGKHHRRVNGFFEEAYLSPKQFTPNDSVVRQLSIDPEERYFILRFISWQAHHDIGNHGFNDKQKIELVNQLKRYGKVYISAEGMNVPNELKNYILQIPAKSIHHLMYFASAYIGDSQTMATEAALLGTPSYRYNSFVGDSDMSNFILLEKQFGLMKNFNDFELLKDSILEMVQNLEVKKKWMHKREEYFSRKTDIDMEILHLITALV